MIRLSLSDLRRALAGSAWRGWMLWALVLALSMLSFYVHLWRVSFERAEAAFAADSPRLVAAHGQGRHGTGQR
jgi:hypothetical protein